MRVQQLMTQDVQTCSTSDSLNRAAQLMWDHDVGCVPVVDDDQHVVGMITDRDICMACYTKGRELSSQLVSSAMSEHVVSCSPDEPVENAEATMQENQIRRLPVVHDSHLVGMLSLNDIAIAWKNAGLNAKDVAKTLASICEHRDPPKKKATSRMNAKAQRVHV